MTPEVNSEQAALWNGPGGHGWAAARDMVDVVLQPFEDLLVAAARERPRTGVLDVGCGTGGVTRAIAAALGDVPCVGVDISWPQIAVAQESTNVRFVHADAQVHAFEPQFDLIVSRFGVMFFDDPVAAFRNLGKAAKPGGELRVVVWRGKDENPFMTTAERAVAPLMPDLPTFDADAPGPYGLADPDRARKVLDDSGWTGVDIRKVDLTCTMPEDVLPTYLTMLGPVGRALQPMPEHERAEVLGTVLRAFEEFVQDGEVRFPTASWEIRALTPL
ncbi:methyltransferase family protein [Lentzea atacamensis]|uniref:Methyltransferase family protein n=1 Tax=Lentzea atacamensis TaxID=531938 RepID=A0ABX9EJ76_9PSEU|nr:class I SAM-dependent methyltransferase [Lentzea atacamensis]RAS70209.1 methyltransferase family protein [Lentzea atacamensis]